VLLIAVLAAASLLAPIEQAHVHTTVSLQKHVTFGAWFASIAAGVLLAWLSTLWADRPRWSPLWRWAPVIALVAPMAVVGHAQAVSLHDQWANSTQFINLIRPYEGAFGKMALSDDSDIPRYYLGYNANPQHWQSTYFLGYIDPRTGHYLEGNPAYSDAIKHDAFGLVALSFETQKYTDDAILQAIRANPHYNYLGSVVTKTGYGEQRIQVWIDRHPVTSS
jgi:hypothetical protein